MTDSELRRLVGTLFVLGIPGPGLDSQTVSTLEDILPGGIILFRRNVGAPAAVRNLTDRLHALPSKPLVSIDHEGGRVLRLGEPFTQFPAAADVGRHGDPMMAYRVGQAMGAELRVAGIDMNFAPVLDVHSRPENPIIGDRAFGSDPAQVATLGVAALRGLLDGGVIPCGKHFPGHGDTEVDSHLELPVVRRERAELEAVELPPFRAAINAEVPALMTAHVLYPALDPTAPATVSRHILTGLLRDEMGFGGVVASDDIEMRAITAHQAIGDAAVAALDAGVDLVLVCGDLGNAATAVAAVEAAVRSGQLMRGRIEAAAARVERLRFHRARLDAPACPLPAPDHQRLVQDLLRQ